MYPNLCPNWDSTCPYCTNNGECSLDNPWEECDDFYAAMGDEE